MSENKKKSSVRPDAESDEFEFKLELPDDSIQISETPQKKSPKDIAKKYTPPNQVPKKKESLTLEEVEYNSRATRGELYRELKKQEKILDEDVFEYANPIMRGIAFILDYIVYAGVGLVCQFLAPYEMMLWDLFLNKYNLVLNISRDLAISGITALNLMMGIFLFIVMPVAFYNRTIGKKLTGLYVRGANKYTISLTEAFKRELIWKPISLGLLVGVVMPYFNKQRQSLHDRICETIVIK